MDHDSPPFTAATEATGVLSGDMADATASAPADDTPKGWQPVLRLSVCGRDWELERTADLETLWENMVDFNDDERLPYWTEIWPSSLILCQWLQKHQTRIAGRQCLDLGCGIGLTALVGQWLGARVLGMDYEPDALVFARKNALRNNVPIPGFVAMDWRRPAILPRSMSVVWGGDIMYESRFAVPVLDFLDYALTPNGVAWFAEPCRAVYDAFRSSVANRKWCCKCVCETTVAALYRQERPVPVRIWELSR